MSTTRDRSGEPDTQDPEFTARYPHSRQCTAHSKQTGNRCQQPAIPGGRICRVHGGSAGQVRKKAQLRLLELVDPAIAVLAEEMNTADKSADRQRAANSILDRAGVARTPASPDADVARAALIERLLAMRDAAREEPGKTSAPTAQVHPEIGGQMVGDDRDNDGQDERNQ